MPRHNTWFPAQILALAQLALPMFGAFCVAIDAAGAQSPAAPQISVLHMEITQGIQDDKQTVPLIQGRRTFVRIFFNYSGATLMPTWSGLLDLTDPATGVQIEIHSLNSASSRLDPALSGKLDLQRQSISSGLLFELPVTPENWTTKSRVIFSSLKLKDKTGQDWNICTNCANLATDASFFPSQRLMVNLIGLRYQLGGKPFQPRDVDFDYVKSYLARAYPAGDIEIETRIIDWAPFAPASPFRYDCSSANAVLAQLRASDIDGGEDPLTHYHGLVFDSADSFESDNLFMRGCASAIPVTPDPTAVSSGPAGTHYKPTGWQSKSRAVTYADWYAAHEIGHTFGRKHIGTPCGDTPGDGNFPFRHPLTQIADQTRRFFAFDAGDDNLSLPMVVAAGEDLSDTMSYCDHEWPSFYTYLLICRNLNAEAGKPCATFPNNVADSTISALPSGSGATMASRVLPVAPVANVAGADATAGQSANAARAPAAADNVVGDGQQQGSSTSSPPAITSGLLVTLTAKLNFAKNTAEITSIDPVSKTAVPPQPATGPAAPTDVRINLHDSSGDILQSFNGKVYVDTDLPYGADPTGLVVATVPYNSATGRLSIVRDGKELASASAGTAGFTLSKPQALPQPASNFADALDAHTAQVKSGVGHFTSDQGKIVYSWENRSPETDVSYNVQLSLDDGKWRTVAINLKTPRLVLDPTWIAGGKKVVLRVTGKSGIHSQVVTSDVLMLDSISGLIR